MKNQLCPQCHKNQATVDPEYGILKCSECIQADRSIPKPSQNRTYDFASPSTKNQRKEYGAEMFQPYHPDGTLSKEYIETWGTDKLAGVTKSDIKKAKYSYTNMTRHHKMVENGKQKAQDLYGGKKDNDSYKVVEH
jgi:hypothetical protein